MHYIGLDVHKQSVSYCVKTAAGELVEEGRLEATREALETWAEAQPPWRGAMEATLFSGWIYDEFAGGGLDAITDALLVTAVEAVAKRGHPGMVYQAGGPDGVQGL